LESDHRGFEAKEQIKAIITQFRPRVLLIVGTTDSNPVDYPDLAYLAAIGSVEKGSG